MPNIDPPPYDQLPSTRTLLRSTALALAVAAVLLVAVVLPAEYGWDPTGAGRLLGLTEMGEIKMDLADEAAATASAESANSAAAAALLADADTAAQREDVTRVTLEPGGSVEVKLVMPAGASVAYDWSTDRGEVGYDLHGGPADGSASESYRASGGTWADQGTLDAPVAGLHGWYWQNPGGEPVTVTLRTDGGYLDIVRLG